MSRTRTVRAAALIVSALSACSGDAALSKYDDRFCREALAGPDHAPADEWLKDPFGGPKWVGRLSTDQALALVDGFEARGASRVEAVGITKGAAAEPHQTCLGLVVGLPDEPARRLAVFKFYDKQVRAAGFEPLADVGQRYLFVAAGPR